MRTVINIALPRGFLGGRPAVATTATSTRDDQKRDPDGKFGSGGGSSSSGGAATKGKSSSSIPFVKTAFEEHGSIAGIKKKLESTPKDTLSKAHDLLKKHAKPDDRDAHAVLKLIGKELDDRASRGS